MAQYVLNLGPFPEYRMEAFLTFSAAAAGNEIQPPPHPPWTSVKDNPTPSTAHYHVAFHFS